MNNTQSTEVLEPLWIAKDVATYLQLSRSWVYHAVERGELPCLRPCGLLRFEPAAIRAFARGMELKQKVVPIHPRPDPAPVAEDGE